MAGPRIFVAGPSVNPSIGTPAQFLNNISRIAESRRADRRAANALEQDRIFKQAQANLNERKQDFVEAAPERAEAERIAALARDNEKFSLVQNMAEGLQFSGGDRFTTLEDQLLQDPRYAQLDEAGRLAARNQYIRNNPSALTDPSKFADDLTRSLASTGKFTGAEIEAAVSAELNQRYPTANQELIKPQLVKPKDLISGSGNNISIFGNRGSSNRSSSGSFGLLNDPTNPAARDAVVDRIVEERGLADTPTTVPIFGNRVDVGNFDPARTDVSDAVGQLAIEGVASPTAVQAAMGKAFNADGTVKDEYDWRTAAGLKNLVSEGLKAQATEERKFNKKTGGDQSAAGQAAGLSPADAAIAAAEYNEALLSRLVPRALSDQEVLSSFLDGLGDAPTTTNTTRQGGGGGGSDVPETAVEQLLSQPAPAAEAVTTPAQAEFQVGVPSAAENIEDNIQSLFPASPREALNATPQGLIFNTITDDIVPGAQRLIESLTPPSPGILSGTAPAQPTAREQRQAQVDSLTPSQRSAALQEARRLSREGKIGLADGEGNTRDESLLIAYFRYLEGQRN